MLDIAYCFFDSSFFATHLLLCQRYPNAAQKRGAKRTPPNQP
jgi:hypothetical protein